MNQRGKKKNELKEMRTISEPPGNIKCPNIRIIGVPEEDKKTDHEKILEEIIVENFPEMGKEIITQILSSASVILLFVASRVFLMSFIALFIIY